MSHDLVFWQVDAFTKKPFKGNPAAVFVLNEAIDDKLMQNIALEINLSETAFILLQKNKNPLLRWFTPMSEIDLCGHATLASAHVYLTEIQPDLDQIIFDTKFVGPLCVKKSKAEYTMNFPLRLGHKVDMQDIPSYVLNALTKSIPIEAYKSRDLMLIYENEKIIRDMNPDFTALKNYHDFIIVTAKSDHSKYDFISRFFCADEGIAEDPVTGSAHCTSAPYWAEKMLKNNLKAYQASKRGGELILKVTKDRVLISGHAITIINGKLRL